MNKKNVPPDERPGTSQGESRPSCSHHSQPPGDDEEDAPLVVVGPYSVPRGYAPPLTSTCYPIPWNANGSTTLRELIQHLNHVVPPKNKKKSHPTAKTTKPANP